MSAPPLIRCPWAITEPELTYHDVEWGVPVHDDCMLFELLTLEGAQAGLSWRTILQKRDGYRRVFAAFDPEVVAGYSDDQIEAAIVDPGIVRHRGKIVSTRSNAIAVLAIQSEYASFDAYIWSFVNGQPRISSHAADDEPPTTTALSDAVSRDLHKHGFTFVGSTIVQSFLQAAGVLNDHRLTCFRAAIKN